jgi:hypothetical protein
MTRRRDALVVGVVLAVCPVAAWAQSDAMAASPSVH